MNVTKKIRAIIHLTEILILYSYFMVKVAFCQCEYRKHQLSYKIFKTDKKANTNNKIAKEVSKQ